MEVSVSASSFGHGMSRTFLEKNVSTSTIFSVEDSCRQAGIIQVCPHKYDGKRWIRWEASLGVLLLEETWLDSNLEDFCCLLRYGDENTKSPSVYFYSSTSSDGGLNGRLCLLLCDGTLFTVNLSCNKHTQSYFHDLLDVSEGLPMSFDDLTRVLSTPDKRHLSSAVQVHSFSMKLLQQQGRSCTDIYWVAGDDASTKVMTVVVGCSNGDVIVCTSAYTSRVPSWMELPLFDNTHPAQSVAGRAVTDNITWRPPAVALVSNIITSLWQNNQEEDNNAGNVGPIDVLSVSGYSSRHFSNTAVVGTVQASGHISLWCTSVNQSDNARLLAVSNITSIFKSLCSQNNSLEEVTYQDAFCAVHVEASVRHSSVVMMAVAVDVELRMAKDVSSHRSWKVLLFRYQYDASALEDYDTVTPLSKFELIASFSHPQELEEPTLRERHTPPASLVGLPCLLRPVVLDIQLCSENASDLGMHLMWKRNEVTMCVKHVVPFDSTMSECVKATAMYHMHTSDDASVFSGAAEMSKRKVLSLGGRGAKRQKLHGASTHTHAFESSSVVVGELYTHQLAEDCVQFHISPSSTRINMWLSRWIQQQQNSIRITNELVEAASGMNVSSSPTPTCHALDADNVSNELAAFCDSVMAVFMTRVFCPGRFSRVNIQRNIYHSLEVILENCVHQYAVEETRRMLHLLDGITLDHDAWLSGATEQIGFIIEHWGIEADHVEGVGYAAEQSVSTDLYSSSSSDVAGPTWRQQHQDAVIATMKQHNSALLRQSSTSIARMLSACWQWLSLLHAHQQTEHCYLRRCLSCNNVNSSVVVTQSVGPIHPPLQCPQLSRSSCTLDTSNCTQLLVFPVDEEPDSSVDVSMGVRQLSECLLKCPVSHSSADVSNLTHVFSLEFDNQLQAQLHSITDLSCFDVFADGQLKGNTDAPLDLLSNILFELIRCPDVGISEHVGAKDDNKCLLDIISNQDCRKAGGLSWLSGFFSGSEVSQRKTLDDIVNFLDSSVEVWPVASAVAQGSQMFNLILERYNYSKTVVCILLCLTLDAQVPTVLVDAVRTTYLPKIWSSVLYMGWLRWLHVGSGMANRADVTRIKGSEVFIVGALDALSTSPPKAEMVVEDGMAWFEDNHRTSDSKEHNHFSTWQAFCRHVFSQSDWKSVATSVFHPSSGARNLMLVYLISTSQFSCVSQWSTLLQLRDSVNKEPSSHMLNALKEMQLRAVECAANIEMCCSQLVSTVQLLESGEREEGFDLLLKSTIVRLQDHLMDCVRQLLDDLEGNSLVRDMSCTSSVRTAGLTNVNVDFTPSSVAAWVDLAKTQNSDLQLLGELLLQCCWDDECSTPLCMIVTGLCEAILTTAHSSQNPLKSLCQDANLTPTLLHCLRVKHLMKCKVFIGSLRQLHHVAPSARPTGGSVAGCLSTVELQVDTSFVQCIDTLLSQLQCSNVGPLLGSTGMHVEGDGGDSAINACLNLLSTAHSASFTSAVECEFFNQALVSLVHGISLDFNAESELSRPAQEYTWYAQLSSLVRHSCASGHLDWLCSVLAPEASPSQPSTPLTQLLNENHINLQADNRHPCITPLGYFSLSQLITENLEHLTLTTSTTVGVNYFECLAVFLLSRGETIGTEEHSMFSGLSEANTLSSVASCLVCELNTVATVSSCRESSGEEGVVERDMSAVLGVISTVLDLLVSAPRTGVSTAAFVLQNTSSGDHSALSFLTHLEIQIYHCITSGARLCSWSSVDVICNSIDPHTIDALLPELCDSLNYDHALMLCCLLLKYVVTTEQRGADGSDIDAANSDLGCSSSGNLVLNIDLVMSWLKFSIARLTRVCFTPVIEPIQSLADADIARVEYNTSYERGTKARTVQAALKVYLLNLMAVSSALDLVSCDFAFSMYSVIHETVVYELLHNCHQFPEEAVLSSCLGIGTTTSGVNISHKLLSMLMTHGYLEEACNVYIRLMENLMLQLDLQGTAVRCCFPSYELLDSLFRMCSAVFCMELKTLSPVPAADLPKLTEPSRSLYAAYVHTQSVFKRYMSHLNAAEQKTIL